MKIVFAHNVYNRYKTLKNTIMIEKSLFPEAKISVAHNTERPDIFSDISNISFVEFNEKTHKIGCVNGCIHSIKNLLNEDFDVLIFSHDDVRINKNKKDILQSCINDIISGKYDAIFRNPKEYGSRYYMMEVFLMSKKAVIEIFSNLSPLKDESQIQLDIKNSISPEVWLYDIVNKDSLNINVKKYKLNNVDYNKTLELTFGYNHLNAGFRGWEE